MHPAGSRCAEEQTMNNAVFEAIPTPEAMEYHGETPTAFADLSAFSPLAEMRGLRPEPAHPALQGCPMAAWTPSTHPRPPAASLTTQMLTADPRHLERFKELMAQEYWPVDASRMLADRKYACDRIVLAHTSPSLELRALAQRLFKVFQAQSH
jgi:hypothetical protein